MNARDNQKLKERIARLRSQIKDAQTKRVELRSAKAAPAKAEAKPKRAPARRKSSRSTQAQASA
jgi:hypothetical protein